MANLVRHIFRAAILVLPLQALATLLVKDDFWVKTCGFLFCFLILDLYGWLKYELLPDLDPTTKAILRKVMVETRITVEGWEASDIEMTKDEDNFKSILVHRPSGVKVIVQHPPRDLKI